MNAKQARELIEGILNDHDSGCGCDSGIVADALQYALEAIDLKEKIEGCEGFPKEEKVDTYVMTTEVEHEIAKDAFADGKNKGIEICRIPYLKVVQELERVKKLLKAGEEAGIHAIKRVFDLEKERQRLKDLEARLDVGKIANILVLEDAKLHRLNCREIAKAIVAFVKEKK